MFRQVVNPLGSTTLTAIVAALPLLLLLILLAGVRMRSHWAALLGLALAIVLAVTVFRMPLGQALDGAVEGAAFALFPIVWIIINAVWINRMQRATRYFDVLGRAFSSLSGDSRIQAVLVAYCFGAMIEAMSGFGTPIAITSVMLVALGFRPLRAAVVATFANTAPAAFGSVGNPIQALAKVTAYPQSEIGDMVGRQSPFVAFLVPFVLLLMLDGRRGLRELWPVALVGGAAFGLGQFVVSNLVTYQLTDIGAGVFSTVAIIVLLRVWQPRRQSVLLAAEEPVPALSGASTGPTVSSATPPPSADGDPAAEDPLAGKPSDGDPAEGKPAAADRPRYSRTDLLVACFPYVMLTILFAVTSISGPIQRWAARQLVAFAWPGLHIRDASGHTPSIVTFDLGWLSASGTILLITGVLTAIAFQLRPRRALRCYGEGFAQIRWAVLAICAVLGLSYVMNLAGMAVAIGVWLAGLGGAFALFSGFLGWFGVALTGSDTSSNALFGALQVAAAHRIGLSGLLMAASNSTGGVQGKAVAMQNLALAAGAVGLPGREGDILRRVIGWSLLLLAVFCVLAWLQSTVLSGMVPHS